MGGRAVGWPAATDWRAGDGERAPGWPAETDERRAGGRRRRRR
jgi:hypothetical protein